MINVDSFLMRSSKHSVSTSNAQFSKTQELTKSVDSDSFRSAGSNKNAKSYLKEEDQVSASSKFVQ